MHRLKSIFISVYLTYTIVLVGLPVWYIMKEHNYYWVLVGILHLVPLLFFLALLILSTPRTSEELELLTFLEIVLLIFIISATFFGFNHNYQLLFYGIAGILGWLLYVYWYSVLPRNPNPQIQVEDNLPAIIFEDLAGKRVDNSFFDGNYNLLMFFRGNWCPLCMAQINEMSSRYQKFEDLGGKIYLISAQPSSHSKHLSKKYDIPFHFLIDPELETAKKLGLFHQGGTPLGMELFGYKSDTVLPAVIITDQRQKIIFFDQSYNYRIRPKPQTFLNIIINHQSKKSGL